MIEAPRHHGAALVEAYGIEEPTRPVRVQQVERLFRASAADQLADLPLDAPDAAMVAVIGCRVDGLIRDDLARCRSDRTRNDDIDRLGRGPGAPRLAAEREPIYRSEEHTSELQSLMRRSYAVFCLQKKNNTYKHTRQQNM